MSRTFLGVCTAIVLSAAMLGAQQKPTDSAAKPAETAKNAASASSGAVTFTGCLSPRTSSDTVYLMKAKQKGVKGDAQTVKLVPANKKVDFDTFVTQEVEVTGTLNQSGSAETTDGAKEPTLTVAKIKSRADGC